MENAIGWGGAAICLKLIAEHLNTDKYSPIITTPYCDENYKTYAQVAKWRHIPTRKTKDMRPDGRKSFNRLESLADYLFNRLPYTLKIYSLVKKEGVDIIHLNNEPVCNMSGVIVSKLLNIPCISHVRGPVTWNTGVSRWLYRNVDYFITVADWIKENVRKMGVHEGKIQTLQDGRKVDEFITAFDERPVRRTLGIKEGEAAVAIIGRLTPWKGHRVFIEAAKIIEEKLPQCRMFIVGGASEKYQDYENELKQSAHQKGLKKLSFTGQKDNIPDVLRALDIVVHTSVEPDPYPNVVLEGMLAGRAVIAANIGGPPEMITNYKTGILIPPNKPEILADKICELVQNEALRISLGRNAREVALKKYAIENHVRSIEEVYEKVLNERLK